MSVIIKARIEFADAPAEDIKHVCDLIEDYTLGKGCIHFERIVKNANEHKKWLEEIMHASAPIVKHGYIDIYDDTIIRYENEGDGKWTEYDGFIEYKKTGRIFEGD